MATVFTHAFVGAAIASAAPAAAPRTRVLLCGALLAMLPDLDVVGFHFGVPYGHALGHRGVTHSFLFAALAGTSCALVLGRKAPMHGRSRAALGLVLALATASHGLLDAFTDAGLGIGLLLPFDETRWFAPWRPLATSPVGFRAFWSARAIGILANEAVWIWLPIGGAILAHRMVRSRA